MFVTSVRFQKSLPFEKLQHPILETVTMKFFAASPGQCGRFVSHKNFPPYC